MMHTLSRTLVANLSSFFHSAGKTKAILGVSGGVDSGVVAALSAAALGAENIFAFSLPHSEFSAEDHRRDAREICDKIGITLRVHNIDDFCAPFFALSHTQKKMTRGNIMARVRMIFLYSLANEHDALVLGTGNKAELLTGFFTKWGDGAVDIEVLGDLWKHEVVQLARFFSLPANVWKKPPTAELFAGQTDESEMGISYSDLDAALMRIERDPENFFPHNERERRAFSLFQNSAHKRGKTPFLSRL